MKKNYYLPVFFFITAYLLPLGIRPMLAPVEFGHAVQAREVLRNGAWNAVSPEVQMTAVSLRVFGENAVGARIPAVLAAALTTGLIVLFLYRYTRDHRVASLGALLYLSFGMVYDGGTMAVPAGGFAFFTTASLAAFLPACLKKHWSREKIVLLLLAGIAAGCAGLCRGGMALLMPLIVAVPFLIWEKRWRDFYRLPWLPLAGFLLTMAVARHWHWQDWTAGTGNELGIWRGLTVTRWWMWPLLLAAGTFPGGILGLCALAGLRGKWRDFAARSYVRYMLCWMLFPLFLVMIAGEQPGMVLLLCFAPLAMLGALGISTYFRGGGPYRVFGVLMDVLGGVLLLVVPLVWLILPWVWTFVPETAPGENWWHPVPLWGIVAAHVGMLCGACLIACRKRSWRSRYTVFFCGLAVMIGIPVPFSGPYAPGAVLEAWRPQIPGVAAIVSELPEAVAWCWDRPVLPVPAAVALKGAAGWPVVVVSEAGSSFGRDIHLPPSHQDQRGGLELRLYLPEKSTGKIQE